MRLKKIPKKSTLQDWLNLFNIKLIRKLINFSIDKTDLKVTAINGSGIDSFRRSRHYKKRLKDFGMKPKSNYHKLDILVDVYRKKQIIMYFFY